MTGPRRRLGTGPTTPAATDLEATGAHRLPVELALQEGPQGPPATTPVSTGRRALGTGLTAHSE
ncbi:hypothetical protein [Actinacidiphila yeochonensis]|uniref:hypothetical protein n=1 Tax=Actinacidiphila yeochonensis TaxID=89050 RepID=UPI000566DE63|nr:hypothetical protein [Actinacidiphila yeochonensis]